MDSDLQEFNPPSWAEQVSAANDIYTRHYDKQREAEYKEIISQLMNNAIKGPSPTSNNTPNPLTYTGRTYSHSLNKHPFNDPSFNKETFLGDRSNTRVHSFNAMLHLIKQRYDKGFSFITFRYNQETEDTNFVVPNLSNDTEIAYPILQDCITKLQASDFQCIIEEDITNKFTHKVTVYF